MFTGIVPPLVAQLLLFAILLGVLIFVIRALAAAQRRKRLSATLNSLGEQDVDTLAEDIPQLATAQRVTAPVLRLLPPAEGVVALPQVEIGFGKRRLIFTPTDFLEADKPERYQTAIKESAGSGADLALFALCTLETGGADAIRAQIKDYDKVHDASTVVNMVPAQGQPGDYVTIARILSHRRDSVSEGLPVIVYRAEVIKSPTVHLMIELAVPDEGQSPFAEEEMVHGTARLYGYLP